MGSDGGWIDGTVTIGHHAGRSEEPQEEVQEKALLILPPLVCSRPAGGSAAARLWPSGVPGRTARPNPSGMACAESGLLHGPPDSSSEGAFAGNAGTTAFATTVGATSLGSRAPVRSRRR